MVLINKASRYSSRQHQADEMELTTSGSAVSKPGVLRSCRVLLPLLNLPLKVWIELDATRMQDGSRRDPAAPYQVRRAPAVGSRSQSSCSHHYGA
ncbi:Os07g0217850 [Oryza sativa Japonica Group]|uniref:Os07g0217850 protein n=1 Tax=Oryza sativa subsp. japonica TaxID=39947 RepID=A0A0N7KN50_ORYSJ|nr:Os07g0217850 [Oryza sativa Japonica Group]